MKSQPATLPTYVAGRRYRLAIYDLCDDSTPLDFVGKVLSTSAEDKAYAAEAIEQFNAWTAQQLRCTYAMGLFPLEGGGP